MRSLITLSCGPLERGQARLECPLRGKSDRQDRALTRTVVSSSFLSLSRSLSRFLSLYTRTLRESTSTDNAGDCAFRARSAAAAVAVAIAVAAV